MDNLGPVVSDNTLLRSILPRGGFNVAHLNAQSLSPRYNATKLDEIRHIIQGSGLEILGVSETWLSYHILDSAVSINGFKLYRNDRVRREEDDSGIPNSDGTGGINRLGRGRVRDLNGVVEETRSRNRQLRRGGGVGIYISEALKSKFLCEHRDIGNCEAIFVEVELNDNLKILVGVMYLPNGHFSRYEHILADVAVRYEHVVLMGDFNTNLFSDASMVRGFCNDNNLEILHNSRPTHTNGTTEKLIDFFMVSNTELVSCKGQVQVPALNSGHALIYLSYMLTVTESENQFTYRDFNGVDLDSCLRHLNSIDYSVLYVSADSNSLAENLNSIIRNAYDNFVPIRVFRQRANNWFDNDEIRFYRQRRDFAYRAFRENRCDRNRAVYCRYRNKLKSIIRKHRSRMSMRMFENCSQAQIWNKLRNYGVASNNSPPNDINVDEFNLSSILPPILNEPPLSMYGNENFSFSCIDEAELLNAVSRIKSNSVGPDGVSLRFLKMIYSAISQHLLHVVNVILTTSKFPDIWKTARVLPIPKVRNASSLSDFRPISVLSVCSKILEIVMRDQMCNYFDENRMISDYQSGYRARYNTTTLTLDVTERIRESMDKSGLSAVVFLDYSKAFDAVSHRVLVNKLHNFFGFSLSACKLAFSFLCGRSQFVQHGQVRSTVLPRYRGIPQGSILGPLLFTVYMNDIFHCCQFGVAHVFADDVQLVGVSDSIDTIHFVNRMNDDLSRISEWSESNFLSLSPSKTRVLFSNQNTLGFDFRVNGVPIIMVDHYKSLGFHIDGELSFNYHINSIVSRTSMILRRLYSINIKLPFFMRKKLGHALLMPIFLYGMEVYSGTTADNLRKVKLCLHRMIRYVYGLGYRDHLSSYVIRFLGVNFEDFISIRNLLLFYKIFKYRAPFYLFERFIFMNSERVRGLVYPRHLTLYMQRSFVVRVARLWNDIIPYSERHSSHSLSRFREILINHL